MHSSGNVRTGRARRTGRPSIALPVMLTLLLLCPALVIARSMDPFSSHAPPWLQVLGVFLFILVIIAVIFHSVLWVVMICDICRYGPFGWLLATVFIPLGALLYYCLRFESSHKKKRNAVLFTLVGATTYILLAIGSAP